MIRRSCRSRLQCRAMRLVVASLALILTCLVFALSRDSAARQARDQADRIRQAQAINADLLVGMVDEETGLRGYAAHRVPAFFEPYTTGIAQVATSEHLLAAVVPTGSAHQLAVVEGIAQGWQKWAEAERATLDSATPPATTLSTSLRGNQLFDAFRDAQATLGSQLLSAESAANDRASAATRAMVVAVIVGAAGTATLILILGLVLTRSTLRSVMRLADVAEAIAEGSAPHIPETGRQDEVGVLGRALAQWRNAATERERFFELSLDAQCVGDLDGRFTDVNPALERITGFSREELTSRPYVELLHPEDRVTWSAHLARIGEGKPVSGLEVRGVCSDGSHRLMSWNIAGAAPTASIYAVGRDVTAEHRAQAELAQRARLLDLAHDAILARSSDESALITYWNRGAEEIYGWSAEEAVGRVSHLLLGTTFPEPRAAIEEQVRRTGHWEGELVHRRRDGSSVVVESRWGTNADTNGNTGLLEVNRDIGARRLAEENMRLALETAAAASRAKTEFLSQMSHELRTPLNAILGFGQLLELDATGSQREHVHRILHAGRHLLDLINEVLDLSRIESGVLHLSLEPVAVATVVGQAVDLIEPSAAERRIRVTQEVSDVDGQYVTADAQRLKQVLLNLLSNAVKYNSDGGRVDVVARREQGRVRVTVTDTGPGIPPEKVDRLFQPFDRLGAECGTVAGTGLGLALSKHLMTAMGGAIGVDNIVDGARFWIDLVPAEDVATAERREAIPVVPAAHPPLSSSTVLYVEDNVANLRLVESILERRPRVTLLPVMQGQLAIELAVQHRPDLILLDLHLPDIDGYEVLHRLQADQRTAPIPVVVISADASRRQIGRVLEAGAQAYLTKPLDVQEFLTVVGGLMTRSHELRGVGCAPTVAGSSPPRSG
ncbi:MAG TPA: PAS domain S-box protein [Candidatus Dormibacteraeota bacterium]|nr:PAS domain S-box protein [Candidatus Dormibacteraeota bacterium]